MTEPTLSPQRALLRAFNLRRGLDDPQAIDTTIRDGVETFGTNLWVLILAMLVASVGLDVNATAVIIGAMLISPLMGPIVGVGYGLAIADMALIRKAALTLLIFTVLSLASSTLYFAISPLQEPGSELLARTQPTLWDVLIAFFGGAAGIIALTRRSFSNVVPGVAIATALMPPLCTAGYSIANGKWAWAGGALYLFTINGVFIAFATLLFVKIMRLPRRLDRPQPTVHRTRVITTLTVAAVAVPSVYLAVEVVRTQQYAREIERAIGATARLADVVILQREVRQHTRHVELTIAGAVPPEELQRQLEAAVATDRRLAGTGFTVRSVTGPQLDLETIRSALQADLARAAQRQDEALRAQLVTLKEQQAGADKLDADLRQVAAELRAQYPALASVQVGRAAGEAGAAARVLVQIQAQPALPARERERLERWLAVRLPGMELSVAYASPGTAKPSPRT